LKFGAIACWAMRVGDNPAENCAEKPHLDAAGELHEALAAYRSIS
jgi:hypothetical protein